MRHIVILGLVIALGLYLAFKKSDLDVLMAPVAIAGYDPKGDNQFVDIDPARLPMHPQQFVEQGRITIVYFHYSKCSGCTRLDSDLSIFSPLRPDVAIRKISIDPDRDGIDKTIKDFNWPVLTTPHILIFDANGALLAADKKMDSSGQDLLEEWIGKEISRRKK